MPDGEALKDWIYALLYVGCQKLTPSEIKAHFDCEWGELNTALRQLVREDLVDVDERAPRYSAKVREPKAMRDELRPQVIDYIRELSLGLKPLNNRAVINCIMQRRLEESEARAYLRNTFKIMLLVADRPEIYEFFLSVYLNDHKAMFEENKN